MTFKALNTIGKNRIFHLGHRRIMTLINKGFRAVPDLEVIKGKTK